MIRFVLIILFAILLLSCNTDNKKVINVETENVPLSIKETDSLVVSNLIKKSKEHYNTNLTPTPPLDKFLLEAEALCLRNNFQKQLSKVYHLVGVRHRNRSEYVPAINYSNKALEIGRTLNDTSLLANYINMTAVVYRRVDENGPAMDLHMEALELAELTNDSFQVSVSFNGIGNVYLNLKKYHASIEYFKKSFDIAVMRGNVLGQAINTNNIGESLKYLGQLDSALVYFYQSLDYNTQINSEVGQAICYNSIGDAYRLKKDFNQALKYLKQALILNEKTRDRINVSTSYSLLGETYLQVYEYNNAIYNLLEGLKIAKEIGSKYQIEACSRLLSEAYEKQNYFKKTIYYLKQSQIYKDSIFNEENVRHITIVTAKYESDKAKSQIERLNNETQLQKKLILQQRKTIFYFIFFVLALIAASILIFRQIKLNTDYKSILLQQRLLRSQMNPHFIFNALSAIQVYILENDMENSSKFLSDFTKLMRQVLRNSQKEYITLEEEKNILIYYLKLQQLRFVQSFKYDIEIDNSLGQNQILIPPMITQPFVENAIEHGFKPTDENGKISVRFSLKNNNLLVEIEDNGIGLAGAKLIKENGSKHESMAIQITNERLKIIEKMTQKNTSFKILDKHEVNSDETGVWVKIKMPIIKTESKLRSKRTNLVT